MQEKIFTAALFDRNTFEMELNLKAAFPYFILIILSLKKNPAKKAGLYCQVILNSKALPLHLVLPSG
jgi:hypothetical protein